MTRHFNTAVILNKPLVGISETFIQCTIDRLAEVKLVLGGEPLPNYDVLAKRSLATATKSRGRLSSAFRKLMGRRNGAAQDEATLARVLKENRVDVMLCHYAHTGIRMLKIAERTRIPLVAHCHGYDAHREQNVKAWAEHFPRLGTYASCVVAVSHKMRSKLIELGIPSDKVVVCAYGVDFQTLQRASPESCKPAYLMVGRLVDKKAPYLSLLAFQKVVRSIPDAELTVVGDGELRECCENLAMSLGIARNVRFLGAQGHDRVRAELVRSRAFLQHSVEPKFGPDKGDSEGCPVAILEASGCGLPVVATRHAGICDSVIDGVSGYLVEERDVDGMAERMLRFGQSPELAKAFGDAGRSHIQNNYSMDRYVETIRDILRHAARSGR